MQGTLERHGQWFCSERCAAEYAKRSLDSCSRHTREPSLGMSPRGAPQAADSCHVPAAAFRIRDPWVWVPVSGLIVAGLGGLWPGAEPVSAIYRSYLYKTGLPLLLGLVLGGVIDHFVPREYIVKFLSGSRKRVILRSTLLGFLASACSHGCLALAIELYRKGASVPAVVSFLLASPWASMALTLLLLSLFGAQGIVIVVMALAIAFVTGLIFRKLDAAGRIDSNPNTPEAIRDFALWHDLITRWRGRSWTRQEIARDAQGVVRGMMPLGRMVLGWVQLGLVLSALAGGLVPHGFFERFLGPSVLGLLLTLGVATVVEVCSEGTAPLAYELFRHTGALGNAFAFLMGGVVTDYTELAVVWRAIGRRTVLWMLAVTLPLVVTVGLLLNVM
jgi:hypothetical protein